MSTDRKYYRLLEQIEGSSASISMNIAEGKGRFSKKEFVHHLYISRGSLYETMTLLEIFRRKKWISNLKLEMLGKEIVSMLKGLINSISNKKS
ncbi:MAG: four helix bundle protein [Thermodesulfobacteriota bacterium]